MTSNLTMSIFYATLLLEFMPLKQRKDRKIWKKQIGRLICKKKLNAAVEEHIFVILRKFLLRRMQFAACRGF